MSFTTNCLSAACKANSLHLTTLQAVIRNVRAGMSSNAETLFQGVFLDGLRKLREAAASKDDKKTLDELGQSALALEAPLFLQPVGIVGLESLVSQLQGPREDHAPSFDQS